MEKCAERVKMNQPLLLLNQLMEDVILAHKGRSPFTYSCLLILIALVVWMEPKYYQGMDVEAVEVTCRGVQYQNLWVLEDKEQQIDCKVQFYLYLDGIQEAVGKVLRLRDESATKYIRVSLFAIGPHDINI